MSKNSHQGLRKQCRIAGLTACHLCKDNQIPKEYTLDKLYQQIKKKQYPYPPPNCITEPSHRVMATSATMTTSSK